MLSLSNKQKNILKIAIPALLLVGVILYFIIRNKPSNVSGKPTGVSARFVEEYRTEYALGDDPRGLILTVSYTNPDSANIGPDGTTITAPLLFTVPCNEDGTCPKFDPNPVNPAVNQNQYISNPISPTGATTLADVTTPGKKVTGLYSLREDQFPPNAYFSFGMGIKNNKGLNSIFEYISKPIKVPPPPPTAPGPVKDFGVSLK